MKTYSLLKVVGKNGHRRYYVDGLRMTEAGYDSKAYGPHVDQNAFQTTIKGGVIRHYSQATHSHPNCPLP